MSEVIAQIEAGLAAQAERAAAIQREMQRLHQELDGVTVEMLRLQGELRLARRLGEGA